MKKVFSFAILAVIVCFRLVIWQIVLLSMLVSKTGKDPYFHTQNLYLGYNYAPSPHFGGVFSPVPKVGELRLRAKISPVPWHACP